MGLQRIMPLCAPIPMACEISTAHNTDSRSLLAPACTVCLQSIVTGGGL